MVLRGFKPRAIVAPTHFPHNGELRPRAELVTAVARCALHGPNVGLPVGCERSEREITLLGTARVIEARGNTKVYGRGEDMVEALVGTTSDASAPIGAVFGIPPTYRSALLAPSKP